MRVERQPGRAGHAVQLAARAASAPCGSGDRLDLRLANGSAEVAMGLNPAQAPAFSSVLDLALHMRWLARWLQGLIAAQHGQGGRGSDACSGACSQDCSGHDEFSDRGLHVMPAQAACGLGDPGTLLRVQAVP